MTLPEGSKFPWGSRNGWNVRLRVELPAVAQEQVWATSLNWLMRLLLSTQVVLSPVPLSSAGFKQSGPKELPLPPPLKTNNLSTNSTIAKGERRDPMGAEASPSMLMEDTRDKRPTHHNFAYGQSWFPCRLLSKVLSGPLRNTLTHISRLQFSFYITLFLTLWPHRSGA